MTRLKLLDVDVTLPANVLLVARQPHPRIESYRVTGPGVAQVRDQMVSLGAGLGYKVHDRTDSTTLAKGKQRIVITAIDALELALTSYSVERDPEARPDAGGVGVGRFWIQLDAPRASDVCAKALESLAAHGLRISGPFAPTDASIGDGGQRPRDTES